MNKHDFVFDYEFKLFTFPQFEIDGTSDEVGCDLFIYDTKNDFTLNVMYQDDKIYLRTDKYGQDKEREIIQEFDFCENFEEIIYKKYQEMI